MHNRISFASFFLSFIVVCFVTCLILISYHSALAQATPTRTPARATLAPTRKPVRATPTPQKKPAWGGAANSSDTPTGLKRTANKAGIGGDGFESGKTYTDNCPIYTVTSETELYAVGPHRDENEQPFILLDYQRSPYELTVESCGFTEVRTVLLRTPENKIIVSLNTTSELTGFPVYLFDLPPDSPTGEYILIIIREGLLPLTKGINAYYSDSGIYIDLIITERDTGIYIGSHYWEEYYNEQRATQVAKRGQVIQVHYTGFDSTLDLGFSDEGTEGELSSEVTDSPTVELGLYYYEESVGELHLIDWWLLTGSNSDLYIQEITIPMDAPSGYYRFIACDINKCESSINIMNWHPTSLYKKRVIAPTIALEEFEIVDNDTFTTVLPYCPDAPAPNVQVGDVAEVVTTSLLSMYDKPGYENKVDNRLQLHDRIEIVAGPVCAQNFQGKDVYWWYVLTCKTDISGWVADGLDETDSVYLSKANESAISCEDDVDINDFMIPESTTIP